MAQCLYAPAAVSDLDGIWEYTLATWGVAQAIEYTKLIAAACDAVAAGDRSTQTIDNVRPGYHKFLVGSHVVFVRYTDAQDLEVIRILHQQMDVSRHLT